MEYEVLSPSARRSSEVPLVESHGLDGLPRRIGFVWHYGYRGDEMFAGIAEAFEARHPGTTFFDHEVFGNIHGASERLIVHEIPEKLRTHDVQAVIVGVGG